MRRCEDGNKRIISCPRLSRASPSWSSLLTIFLLPSASSLRHFLYGIFSTASPGVCIIGEDGLFLLHHFNPQAFTLPLLSVVISSFFIFFDERLSEATKEKMRVIEVMAAGDFGRNYFFLVFRAVLSVMAISACLPKNGCIDFMRKTWLHTTLSDRMKSVYQRQVIAVQKYLPHTRVTCTYYGCHNDYEKKTRCSIFLVVSLSSEGFSRRECPLFEFWALLIMQWCLILRLWDQRLTDIFHVCISCESYPDDHHHVKLIRGRSWRVQKNKMMHFSSGNWGNETDMWDAHTLLNIRGYRCKVLPFLPTDFLRMFFSLAFLA